MSPDTSPSEATQPAAALARARLLSLISHEIRSPLAAMSLALQILQHADPAPGA